VLDGKFMGLGLDGFDIWKSATNSLVFHRLDVVSQENSFAIPS